MNYRIEFEGYKPNESSLKTSEEVIEHLQNLEKNEKPLKVFKELNDGRGVDVTSKFRRHFKTKDAKTVLDKAIRLTDEKTYTVIKIDSTNEKKYNLGGGYSEEDVKQIIKGYKYNGLFYEKSNSKWIYIVK